VFFRHAWSQSGDFQNSVTVDGNGRNGVCFKTHVGALQDLLVIMGIADIDTVRGKVYSTHH
jgi:hypothetical protein